MRELFVFSAAVSVCTRAESPRDRNVLAARTNASDIRAAVQSGAMLVGGSHAPATGNTGRLCVRAGSGLRIDRREVTSRDAAANSSGAPLCDVEQLAARRAHNPEVARSSRAVATAPGSARSGATTNRVVPSGGAFGTPTAARRDDVRRISKGPGPRLNGGCGWQVSGLATRSTRSPGLRIDMPPSNGAAGGGPRVQLVRESGPRAGAGPAGGAHPKQQREPLAHRLGDARILTRHESSRVGSVPSSPRRYA